MQDLLPADAPSLGALTWVCPDDPRQLLPDDLTDLLPPCEDGCRCGGPASDEHPASAGAAAAGPAPEAPVAWAVPGVLLPQVAPPLLTDLQAAVRAVAEHGALSGSVADTGALLRLAESVRGLALRELAEMDATGGHTPAAPAPAPAPAAVDGSSASGRRGRRPQTTTASWLRDTLLLGDDAARSQVRLALQLRDELPRLGMLVRDGQTTVEHAQAVLAGVRGLDPAVVRDATDGLADLSLTADPAYIRATLRDKAHAVDDRLAAEAARRAHDRQGLTLSEVGQHTALSGTLAGDDGATVRLAMTLAVEAARTSGDTRGLAARRADVLLTWAREHLHRAHGPGDSLSAQAHTVRTHLLITCTPTQLQQLTAGNCQHPGRPGTAARTDSPAFAELLAAHRAGDPPSSPGIAGDTAPLPHHALRRLACDATLDLIVRRDDDTQHPLFVGRSSRTVTSRQWLALVTRDRRCVVRGCRRPPAACVAHHVRHWADGGPTDLDNLVLLCHQHHHDHHDRQHDLPHHDGQRWLTQTGWAQPPP